MKTTIYSIFISLFCLFSCQSATAQPTPVISKKYSNAEIEKMIASYKAGDSKDICPTTTLSNQLAKDFPNAARIEWKEAFGIYEAEFTIDRTDYNAYYDAEGNLLMYTAEIRGADLPAVVRNGIVAKYPDYHIDNDPKKTYKGSEIYYTIEIEGSGNEFKLVLSSNGTILKKLTD